MLFSQYFGNSVKFHVKFQVWQRPPTTTLDSPCYARGFFGGYYPPHHQLDLPPRLANAGLDTEAVAAI